MSRLLNSALILVLAGCGPLTFGTEVTGQTVITGSTLSPTPPRTVFPSIGGFNDLDFTTNREFQNQNVTRSNVSSISVESVTFKIISPSEQTFSFLQTAQLVARAGDKELQFAEKVDIGNLLLAAPNPTLTLDLNEVDLTPFIKAPLVTFVLRGKGNQPLKDTRLEVKLKLHITAQ